MDSLIDFPRETQGRAPEQRKVISVFLIYDHWMISGLKVRFLKQRADARPPVMSSPCKVFVSGAAKRHLQIHRPELHSLPASLPSQSIRQSATLCISCYFPPV